MKDLVFMWGFRANVRATVSNMRKLGCEVLDLFKSLVKEDTIKTKRLGYSNYSSKMRKRD